MSIPQRGGGPIERPEDLAGFMESGCKPREEWRIGAEHEKFGFRLADHKPLPYEGAISISAMLQGLCDSYGWRPIEENGALIGLTKRGANVSLEPGGQLELSGAPLQNIHQTCEETNQHLAEVRDVAERIGAGFIGLGVSPDWRCDEIPVMPKGRYGIMRRYMQEVGSRGLDMMFRSCTIQVNLDFESEADMVKKLRVAVALQPIATALFASSPFFDGAPSGFSSTRSWIWRDVDNARTGMLPFVFEDGFGFERWADYALDVPMYFVYRNGQYLDASGQSFRHFLEGTLPAAPGEIPTLSDWADHLTTIFPEARIKKFMEMRGADGGPWRRICALPALWVGLLYDQTALDAAWDLVKGWTAEERETLRDQAGERGLAAKIRGQNLQSLSGEILKIAEHGLTARAQHGDFDTSEAHFLNDLKRVVESGETMADEMLRLWRTEWDQDFSALYRHYAY